MTTILFIDRKSLMNQAASVLGVSIHQEPDKFGLKCRTKSVLSILDKIVLPHVKMCAYGKTEKALYKRLRSKETRKHIAVTCGHLREYYAIRFTHTLLLDDRDINGVCLTFTSSGNAQEHLKISLIGKGHQYLCIMYSSTEGSPKSYPLGGRPVDNSNSCVYVEQGGPVMIDA